jgi:hypothetical protein
MAVGLPPWDGGVLVPEEREGAAEFRVYIDRNGISPVRADAKFRSPVPVAGTPSMGPYVPGYANMCSRIKWYAEPLEATVSELPFLE